MTLIEDDVYSELYFGREKPLPAKAWDRDDTVLHCSSFSKCLVPGFRIGWVAGGSHARQIQRLQLMSTYPPVPHAIGVSGLSLDTSI